MMYTLIVLFASVAFASSYQSCDRPFQFTCPTGQSIRYINSRYQNGRDRVYGIGCRKTSGLGRCYWSGFLNSYKDPVLYQCPRNGVISGLYSYHHNGFEDSRFKVYCCDLRAKAVNSCYFSGYANSFNKYFSFNVPSNRVLRGIFSYHRNSAKDRRYRFETCIAK